MRILIIGASGLVGGNIINHFSAETDWNMIGTYNNFKVNNLVKLNASDRDSWTNEISGTKWDIIIHTGALTHVDKCEEDADLSWGLTVQSTINLVDLARKNNAKFIYISTDYVFDGINGPYTENGTPNPLSVYGKHKLESEEFIIANLVDYLILRVTNVYGDEIRGKNFVSRTVQQIKENQNLYISAPSDQYATPVNAYDIARVLHLLIHDNKAGLYHVCSTDYFNRVQFINRIKTFFGSKLVITPLLTKDLKQLADRPLLGGLIAERFLAEYPDFYFSNIDDYLNKYNDKF